MELTYTPAGIANVLGANGVRHSQDRWLAARRAILRQGMHKDQTDTRDHLHTMFTNLQGANADLRAKRDVVCGTLNDTFDALAALDRIDGGVSVLLHCPGYPVQQDFAVENVSVDMYITPHALEADNIQERLAYMVQGFGHHIAVPYLHQFTAKHEADGKPSVFNYQPARQLRIQAPDHLPPFESPGPGHTLAQDIAALKTPQKLRMSNSQSPFTPSRSGSTSADSDILRIKLEDSHNEINREYTPPPASLRTPRVNRGESALVSQSNGPITSDTNTADLRSSAIVSIGDHTNDVLDRLGLADSFIPRLRVLACTVRSSRWEQVLRSSEWGLSQEQARHVSHALISDIRGPTAVNQAQYGIVLLSLGFQYIFDDPPAETRALCQVAD
ncbi:hypothetical protein F5887DRAFT_923671 [Amanita rubescens]|nr:hypothetical protein F5887DRAFT_923671 [Amanita rubescens]